MHIKVIGRDKQGRGQFNHGAILEYKPIGFPGDGGQLRPYSNLFYWAHARTPGEASLIREHPHSGFEIMSFVLKGSLNHYDSHHKRWKKLSAGDAQVIRAGSGISHAEEVGKESSFFQIWADPGLSRTLHRPPSYDDYPSASFPVIEDGGMSIKRYAGKGGPMRIESPELSIEEVIFLEQSCMMYFEAGRVASLFVLEGTFWVKNHCVSSGDFMIIEGEGAALEVRAEKGSRLFMITSLVKVPYRTYSEHMMLEVS